MKATTASVSPSSSKSSSACANAFVPSTAAIPASKTIASSGSDRRSSSSARKAAKTSPGRRRTSSVRFHHSRCTARSVELGSGSGGGSLGLRRQHAAEELAREALRYLRDLLRRAGGDHFAAGLAALGAEVDDPVRLLDHVEVVLDHEHGVAAVDEPLQHLEQLLDVREVESGRGLVEDVERPAGRDLAQLGRKLDALRLPA